MTAISDRHREAIRQGQLKSWAKDREWRRQRLIDGPRWADPAQREAQAERIRRINAARATRAPVEWTPDHRAAQSARMKRINARAARKVAGDAQ